MTDLHPPWCPNPFASAFESGFSHVPAILRPTQREYEKLLERTKPITKKSCRCIVWTSARCVQYHKRNWSVPRLFYLLFVDASAQELRKFVKSICGTPSCVHPNHLILVTNPRQLPRKRGRPSKIHKDVDADDSSASLTILDSSSGSETSSVIRPQYDYNPHTVLDVFASDLDGLLT